MFCHLVNNCMYNYCNIVQVNVNTALQGHFYCKMVAIKKYSVAKKNENVKGRTLHDILHVDKKGKTLHDIVHEGLMRRTAHFPHFPCTFATVSLRIHVKFLNYKR